MVLKYLLEKEFLQLSRNPVVRGMVVGYPILMLLVLPWAITFELKSVRLSVVDHDHGELAQRLEQKIAASPYFMQSRPVATYQEAYEAVDNGQADLILELPSNFSKKLSIGQSPTVYLAANAVDATQSQLASNYLNAILLTFSQELIAEHALEQRVRPKVSVEVDLKFNRKLDYKLFMLPAFIVLMTTLICGILTTLNIVGEKESGTLQQINVTPVRKRDFILAKLLPYCIIGFVVLLIGIVLIGLVYGFWPRGSLLGILAISLLFIPAIAGLGMVVSNHSHRMQQAMFIMLFFILIILLLSGLFTPVESMPVWAQVVAYLNPVTYYMDSMRLFYLHSAHFADGYGNLWKLGLFAVGIYLWAIGSYKKVDQ